MMASVMLIATIFTLLLFSGFWFAFVFVFVFVFCFVVFCCGFFSLSC